jgi:hypothetical protein
VRRLFALLWFSVVFVFKVINVNEWLSLNGGIRGSDNLEVG